MISSSSSRKKALRVLLNRITAPCYQDSVASQTNVSTNNNLDELRDRETLSHLYEQEVFRWAFVQLRSFDINRSRIIP